MRLLTLPVELANDCVDERVLRRDVSPADRHRVGSSRPSVARHTGRPDDHRARSCNVLHLSRCTAVPKRSTISSHIDMHPGSCQTPPMVRARRICKLRHRCQQQQQQQQSNGSNGRLRCGWQHTARRRTLTVPSARNESAHFAAPTCNAINSQYASNGRAPYSTPRRSIARA